MNPKQKKIIILTAFGLICIFTGLSLAADDHSPKGQVLKEETVDGVGLKYALLNLEERKEMMKGMEGMKMHGMSDSPDVTHHLVIYLKHADGKPVSGKVGFNITNPDGSSFKTLTMGMNSGYGADVMFKVKGSYKIQMKAMVGGKTINDEIAYEVK